MTSSSGSSNSDENDNLIIGKNSKIDTSNNELKNERLRLRWIERIIPELQSEISELIRTKNLNEELAEISGLTSEIRLLKNDFLIINNDIKDLTSKFYNIEGYVKDTKNQLQEVKEKNEHLSRTCANFATQVRRYFL